MKNKHLTTFIFFALFLTSARASDMEFKKLATDFLLQNADVWVAESQIKISNLSLESIDATLAWKIITGASIVENDLDASTSVNTSAGKVDSYGLEIQKPWWWGGSLSLKNDFRKVAVNPKVLAIFGGSNAQVYEFAQTLSYSQDIGKNILGRDYKEQILAANLKLSRAKIQSNQQVEDLIFSLYQVYIKARLSRTLLDLQEEALTRATKRKQLIARRVRDGLSNKAELYQVQIAEISQEEQLRIEDGQLKSQLFELKRLLRDRVETETIGNLNLGDIDVPKKTDDFIYKNRDMATIEKDIELSHSTLRRLRFSSWPEMSLALKYKTNDYDKDSNEAISNGNFGGDKFEKTIAFNLTWPLGNEENKIQKGLSTISLASQIKKRDDLQNRILTTEKELQTQVGILSRNINSSRQRIGLAQVALREYNKLYELGRATLDQVIRAEEDLIQTQRKLSDYLSQKRILVASLAKLYGELTIFLLGNNA